MKRLLSLHRTEDFLLVTALAGLLAVGVADLLVPAPALTPPPPPAHHHGAMVFEVMFADMKVRRVEAESGREAILAALRQHGYQPVERPGQESVAVRPEGGAWSGADIIWLPDAGHELKI